MHFFMIHWMFFCLGDFYSSLWHLFYFLTFVTMSSHDNETLFAEAENSICKDQLVIRKKKKEIGDTRNIMFFQICLAEACSGLQYSSAWISDDTDTNGTGQLAVLFNSRWCNPGHVTVREQLSTTGCKIQSKPSTDRTFPPKRKTRLQNQENQGYAGPKTSLRQMQELVTSGPGLLYQPKQCACNY